MKIKVTNCSRKSVEKEVVKNLNKLLKLILKENISQIKKVNIKFLKRFPNQKGYDKAFQNLYKNGVINLIITPGYDINEECRKSVLAHELVHVKQFINKELMFVLNQESKHYIFKGKKYSKVYSYEKFDSFTNRKQQIEYISKICPWEREPSLVADKFAPKAFSF